MKLRKIKLHLKVSEVIKKKQMKYFWTFGTEMFSLAKTVHSEMNHVTWYYTEFFLNH